MLNTNGEHVTKDGKVIPLKDITSNHLINIILYIEKKAEEGVLIVSRCYGVDAMDMDYDEEYLTGDRALKAMDYHAYVNELKRRKP